MKIINKTPHPINVITDKGTITFQKSDDPIRLSSDAKQVGTINGIPVVSVTYGSGNMPEMADGVIYIVSALVRAAYPNRPDLVVPHDVVRDHEGNIIGCRGFAK
jgi:hypothetical protein